MHTVGDRFLAKLPGKLNHDITSICKWNEIKLLSGWGIISQAMKVIPGTIQSCATILKEGNLLAISPGGVFEAQFGNNYYELLWRKRIGFAKVAIEAKAPIVPMFTENLREGFRSVGFLRRLCVKLYNATRIPVIPVYGGFPVKFRTHLGTPIPYDPDVTPEELQEKVMIQNYELLTEIVPHLNLSFV